MTATNPAQMSNSSMNRKQGNDLNHTREFLFYFKVGRSFISLFRQSRSMTHQLRRRRGEFPTPTGCDFMAVDGHVRAEGTTPFGVENPFPRLPRVALPSFVKSTSEGKATLI